MECATVAKAIEESFVDWESHVFGFGYGTGEEHVLRSLKGFFDAFGVDDRPHSYDYEKVEAAIGAPAAWLLINILCRHGVNIIEYGSSPRYAWLSSEGVALKAFVDTKSVGELVTICCEDVEHDYCGPDCCNCGPNGYEAGKVCENPFWRTPKRT